MFITILAFILILSILVLIHEFGHFITAKRFGVKVEEFGFGFPPRVIGFKKGETFYSINLLPVGGFVKLFGEDEAGGGSLKVKHNEVGNHDLKRAFFARPSWQRFAMVFAGVVMNFLLAVVLISYLFSTQGVAIPTEHVKIVEVMNNSPAKAAGLKINDEALFLNGKKLTDTKEFISLTHSLEGKNVELVLKRGASQFTIDIVPRKTFPKGEGPLGVAITNVEVKKYPWYSAPVFGTLEAFRFSWLIFSGLVSMVADFALRGQTPVGVTGPVGVAELTGQAVSYGLNATLWFVALLSLNLAVINVLPIPALDGGRLFFIVIEFVTGRKVAPKYESMAHAIGLAVLLSLILIITFFDVARLVSGKSLLPQM